MDLGVSGQRFLVTGGSRGLGYATAAHLVADGADVLLVSRDRADVDAAAAALTDTGPGTATGLAADLADPALADQILARGPWAGAVLSVGGPPPGKVADITDDQWRAAFEQVHLGPLRIARTLLEAASSPVAITFVLSSSVRSPVAGLAVSNGLRPGLAMAAKTLADEYGKAGHRVNVVLPGRIDTDRVKQLDEATGDATGAKEGFESIIPLGRYGRPEEFGAAAAFITAPIASYISGTAFTVDGGLTRAL